MSHKFNKVLFQKTIPKFREYIDLTLYVQNQKIIIHLGGIDWKGGDMYISSLTELSMLQFKGMAVYDTDMYRLKQDPYNNWVLVNVNRFRDIGGIEEDHSIKILSPIEALVVKKLLDKNERKETDVV